MKVGFLSDKNGFRAPLHPDSLTKYNKTQLFVEKDIFKNITLADDLEFKYSTNAPTILIEGMVVAGK